MAESTRRESGLASGTDLPRQEGKITPQRPPFVEEGSAALPSQTVGAEITAATREP